jgi:hypothetical protein
VLENRMASTHIHKDHAGAARLTTVVSVVISHTIKKARRIHSQQNSQHASEAGKHA